MGVFKGTMPRVCEEEVVGIIGYGALGMFSSCCSLSVKSVWGYLIIKERKQIDMGLGESRTRTYADM
jgi:hypothetical protein